MEEKRREYWDMSKGKALTKEAEKCILCAHCQTHGGVQLSTMTNRDSKIPQHSKSIQVLITFHWNFYCNGNAPPA